MLGISKTNPSLEHRLLTRVHRSKHRWLRFAMAVAIVWGPSTPFAQTFDAFVQSEIESRASVVPGAAVAIIENGGAPWVKVFGVTRLGTDQPVTPHSAFQLASISKTFAGVALAMAADAGSLSLDEPVQSVLTDLRFADESKGRSISMRHVVSQSTGLLPHSYTNLIEDRMSYPSIIKKLAKAPFICAPGNCYSYQNVVFSLVGDAIQERTGQSYADYVRQKIFIPLRMPDAWMGLASDQEREDRVLVTPHLKTKNGWRVAKPNERYYKVLPAAGVNASISDMARWLAAILGESTVISPDLLGQVTERVVSYRKRQGHYPSDAPITDLGYAMGFRTFSYRTLPGFLHHGGYIRGMRSELIAHPRSRSGLVFLTNAEPDKLNRLSLAFADYVYNQSLVGQHLGMGGGDETGALQLSARVPSE